MSGLSQFIYMLFCRKERLVTVECMREVFNPFGAEILPSALWIRMAI